MKPTLDEFIAGKFRNSYIEHPEFDGLYIRSGDIYVDGRRCTKVIQIANIEAKHPGNGAFARLVDDLIERGFAIYVENVHNPRFRQKLQRMGFIEVNPCLGFHFLKNHEGHLI